MIFRENLKGINSQYRPFESLVSDETAKAVDKAYQDLLAVYLVSIDPDNGINGTNFRAYSTVRPRERKLISDAAYAYAASLRSARAEIEVKADNAEPRESSSPESDAPNGEATDSPEDDDDDDDGDDGVCFPGDAEVESVDGRPIRMDKLQIGDQIRVQGGTFAPVVFFSHQSAGVAYTFTRVTVESGAQLVLTGNHLVPLATGPLKAAKRLVKGDVLMLRDGVSAVVSTGTVVKQGLYAPHTASGVGTVVVDGIVASEYTTFVHPRLASALLAPLRLAARWGVGVSGMGKVLPVGRAIVSGTSLARLGKTL